MERLVVGLGERSYPIHIGSDCLADLGRFCREAGLKGTAAIVTNRTVGSLYLDTVSRSLAEAGFPIHSVLVDDGEEYKNAETLQTIYTSLIAARLDRGCFIVALGGGVVGDMAGFAAATFLRGIPFVQVPTTLLAQVDSSVGGKTGINHPLGKNLIGAFYQPKLVLIDVRTLSTLSPHEYRGGLAEVVKYGIVLDGEFFAFLEKRAGQLSTLEEETLVSVVKRCCAIKASVVEQDERESGLRAVLNYGHTMGHAVEALTHYVSFTHGEAVAIGMVQAAKISEHFGYAAASDTERIVSIVRALELPLDLPSFPSSAYLDALLRDKKVREGGLHFVFNRGIGSFHIGKVENIDELLAICGVRS